MNGFYDFTTSDVSTGSLTQVDVPQMFFPLEITDAIYDFKFVLAVGSSTVAGLKIALVVPDGAVFRAWAEGSGTAKNSLIIDRMTTSGVLGAAFNTFNGNQNLLHIFGAVKNGGFAGKVQLQVAKVTSGTATMHAGSFFTATALNG
jgi:hypothetical protein